ncbi:MAG: cobalamin-dependent protein [Deltaproteobacteria bacterium]|nr:cobalamin-dependent protein [Deltaproteobacteria bacterium]
MRTATQLLLMRVNERRGVHPFLVESNVTGVYPPLGIAYLAATARHAGYATELLDAHAEDTTNQGIASAAAASTAKLIGITTTTFNWPVAVQYARRIKQAAPDKVVVVGGPQLSLYPRECMEEKSFDAAVIGEGDEVIVELLRRMEAGEDLAGTPGTLVRTADGIVEGPAQKRRSRISTPCRCPRSISCRWPSTAR